MRLAMRASASLQLCEFRASGTQNPGGRREEFPSGIESASRKSRGQKKRRCISQRLFSLERQGKNYAFMRFRIPPAKPNKPEPSRRREAGSGVPVTVVLPNTWNDCEPIVPTEFSMACDGPSFSSQ